MLASGPEYGCRYELRSASGQFIAVFNDEEDPNYVGVLNPESSGLEGSEIRDSFSENVEADGATPGDSYRGRRPVILQGTIRASSPEERNEKATLLTAACNSLRGDGILIWTPAGGPEQFVKVRLQQNIKITKNYVKDFMLPLIANDPLIYGTTLTTATVSATAESVGGMALPLKFPLTFGSTIYAGQILAYNNGTGESPPVAKIYGPGVNPSLTNSTTGETVYFTYTLPAEQYLEVDFASRRILLNGEILRFSALNFVASDWWRLQPGQNDVRLNFASYEAGAKAEFSWRDAWV